MQIKQSSFNLPLPKEHQDKIDELIRAVQYEEERKKREGIIIKKKGKK